MRVEVNLDLETLGKLDSQARAENRTRKNFMEMLLIKYAQNTDFIPRNPPEIRIKALKKPRPILREGEIKIPVLL